MKANELRLGNLILNKEGKVETVYTLYKVEGYEGLINGYDGNAGIQPDYEHEFKPIPLTEEWLIKLGFENNQIICGEYIMQVNVNMFSGTLEKEPNWFISVVHESAHQKITVVKQYFHQLQNLYFALTGEELIIK